VNSSGLKEGRDLREAYQGKKEAISSKMAARTMRTEIVAKPSKKEEEKQQPLIRRGKKRV